MADLLADGAAWLSGQLKTAAGRSVTYQRGGDTADVVATIGQSQFQSANESGAIEVWESRDYLISVNDLPFGPPRRGDLVLEQVGGEILTYEVGAPRGISVAHYDPFRTLARVHTTLSDAGLFVLTTEAGEQLTTEAGELLVA